MTGQQQTLSQALRRLTLTILASYCPGVPITVCTIVTFVEGDTCRVSPEYVTVCARGGFAMSLNFGLHFTVETRRT